MLSPLLPQFPKNADLYYLLGFALVDSGDPWEGLSGLERAYELSRKPEHQLTLATLYVRLGLNLHGLQIYRRFQGHQATMADLPGLDGVIAGLEQDVAEGARQAGLPQAQMEKGLLELEQALRAMNTGDLLAAVSANRRAIRILGHWPPPHNNLSQTLFHSGQPDEAIKIAREVLQRYPTNLQALGNLIRFLVLLGQEDEAHQVWATGEPIEPVEQLDRLKKAEAAALLHQDEMALRLLKPLDRKGELSDPKQSAHVQLWLAVAEANTGRRRAAIRRLEEIEDTLSWVTPLLIALHEKQPGPGLAERYPYFHSTELLTRDNVSELVQLLEREGKISEKKFRAATAQFAAKYPYAVAVFEKLIWEEDQPDVGIGLLAGLGTPRALDALFSRAGDEESRMGALQALQKAGEIAQGEKVRFWRNGAWEEIELRTIEIVEDAESPYSNKVARLINEGTMTLKQGQLDKAESIYRQALALEPKAKEAYNNLGIIYTRRKDIDRASEMFRAAIEIDPLYVFPVCNLAQFALDEGDVEKARNLLAPLTRQTRFHPEALATYQYATARLQIFEENYEAAIQSLAQALELNPELKGAEDLLNRAHMLAAMKELAEGGRIRNEATRVKQQARFTTLDLSLRESLSSHTKDRLTAMARAVLPHGGWSTLRKQELFEHILAAMDDHHTLKTILGGLTDAERAALRLVLGEGGTMPWARFDEQYGNDMAESPWWHYHEPKTLMGRLRLRGLLAEATVDGEVRIVIPVDLRPHLSKSLSAS